MCVCIFYLSFGIKKNVNDALDSIQINQIAIRMHEVFLFFPLIDLLCLDVHNTLRSVSDGTNKCLLLHRFVLFKENFHVHTLLLS